MYSTQYISRKPCRFPKSQHQCIHPSMLSLFRNHPIPCQPSIKSAIHPYVPPHSDSASSSSSRNLPSWNAVSTGFFTLITPVFFNLHTSRQPNHQLALERITNLSKSTNSLSASLSFSSCVISSSSTGSSFSNNWPVIGFTRPASKFCRLS
jgi:hypothetical protein